MIFKVGDIISTGGDDYYYRILRLEKNSINGNLSIDIICVKAPFPHITQNKIYTNLVYRPIDLIIITDFKEKPRIIKHRLTKIFV